MLLNRLSKKLALLIALVCCAACDSEDDGNRVLIGNSNELFELGQLQYQEEFAVQVTDMDGAPSPNSIVTIKLAPLNYNKGQYVPGDTDVPADGIADRWIPSVAAICPTEDINNNGALDAGEDLNGNGFLDPDVPTLTPHPVETPTITAGTNTLITDENGFGYFAITYPKSEGAWSSVSVIVQVDDDLPGNIAAYTLGLGVLIKDLNDLTVNPPGGVISPYGTAANCADPT